MSSYSDSITQLDMSKQYYEILKQNRKLQAERDHFQKLLLDKEKKVIQIQSQLLSLKRKIHHHKSVWLQIAEDNKLLKQEVLTPKQSPSNSAQLLNKKLNSIIEKISLGEKARSEQRVISNLLKSQDFVECLNQFANFVNDYIEDFSEKDFREKESFVRNYKGVHSYSIEPGVSPIYHEGLTEDDEIDKLMDESKILLQTLEKQNLKLSSLSERIEDDFRTPKNHF